MFFRAQRKSFKSPNLTAAQLDALLKKIGGEDAALRLLCDELVIVDHDFPVPIWKTVKIGQFKTADVCRKALTEAGYYIDREVDDMLDCMTFAAEEQEVDLVLLSVKNLGFKGYFNGREAIHERACKLGLKLCAAEIGPVLRIAYDDQSRKQGIAIAMESALLRTFVVVNDREKGRQLLSLSCSIADADGCYGRPFPENALFAFVKPRV